MKDWIKLAVEVVALAVCVWAIVVGNEGFLAGAATLDPGVRQVVIGAMMMALGFLCLMRWRK